MNQEISFGKLIKEHRRVHDLTQAELARRVGCATITLRKIEADALRPSVQIAERLAMALNIPLEERAGFIRLGRAILRDTPEPPPIPTPPPLLEEIGEADLSGRAVRGFQLGEKIGSGGFGAVYRAVQPTVEREVAVKIILPQFANHPDFIRRFETEAQLVARLEHPHIVPLYDYWREPNVAYLVMRLLRAGSLGDRLKAGPVSLSAVKQILNQIGAALHAAHRFGVIHRDLKPENILLDEDENAYLADFGIAKNLGDPTLQGVTQTGALIGSPGYVSPEQIRAEPILPQADIYALGILLFELLTGVQPFPGPTPIDLIMQHLNEPLPSLQSHNSDLPATLDPVIRRATAKEPAERHPDVPTLLAEFQTAAGYASSDLQTATSIENLVGDEIDAATIENPFKGLRAFHEADADDFYGRDTLIQALLGRLAEEHDVCRFLAVVGPSGSGKSSVVKAGLVPALRRGGLPGSEDWFVIDFMPGAHPLEELEAALLRIAINPPESLLGQLKEDERGLLRAIHRILPADEAVELVLIIDQFEEVFTQITAETERAHFLESLVTATLDPRSRLRVILTLRADFTDRPLQYVDFGDLIRLRTEFVLPLSPDELEQAITGPAHRAGLVLDPGLVAQIIREVGDQPGTLPLLQYVLTELFERRSGRRLTLAAYEDSGGVFGALGRRAEEIFSPLDASSQHSVRQLFLRLVTLGEGVEDTRRRVLLSELKALGAAPGEKKQKTNPIETGINAYGQARLLSFDRDPITRGPTVEVAHEALLREWSRLRGWLADSRNDIRNQRALAQATTEWTQNDHDTSYLLQGTRLIQFTTWIKDSDVALTTNELKFLDASSANRQAQEAAEIEQQKREQLLKRRSQNFLRALVGVFAGAAIIALVLSIFAFNQRNLFQTESLARATQQAIAEEQAALAATRAIEAQANADLAAESAASAQAQEAEANIQREIAVAAAEERANAQAKAESAAQIAFSRELAAAALLNLDEDPERSILLALEALNQTHTIEGEEALHQAVQTSRIRQIVSMPGDITGYYPAYSPDGDQIFASGLNGGVLVDIESGNIVYTRSIPGFNNFPNENLTGKRINRAEFSPDGSLLVLPHEQRAGSEMLTGTISIISSARGDELLTFPAHNLGTLEIAFNQAGTLFASAGIDGVIKIWDVAATLSSGEGQASAVLCCHNDRVLSVDFHPDGKQLVSTSSDRTVKLWDIESQAEVYSIDLRTWIATFSPDGQYILVGSFDGAIHIFEAEQGNFLSVTPGAHGQNISTLKFIKDGSQIITTAGDGIAKIWDYSDGTIGTNPTILSGHSGFISGASFDPNGRFVATAGLDNIMRIWDITPSGGSEFGKYSHEGRIWNVRFSPRNDWLASTSSDGTAIIWDINSQKRLHTLSGHTGRVIGLAVAPDGNSLTTVSDDGTARIWDAKSGEIIQIIPAHEVQAVGNWRGAICVAYSPDGSRLVTGGGDQKVRVWEVATGQEIFTLDGHTEQVNGVDFSSDGQYIASAGGDGMVKIWDATNGKELWTLVGDGSIIWNIDFSRYGNLLAAGSNSGMVSVWDLPDSGMNNEPTISLEFQHNAGWASGLNFSPDDQFLSVPGLYRTSLHNAHTGATIIDLDHPVGAANAIFSPDGRMVATAGNDGYVRIMAANLDELLALVQMRLTRSLTTEECQQYLHLDICPGNE